MRTRVGSFHWIPMGRRWAIEFKALFLKFRGKGAKEDLSSVMKRKLDAKWGILPGYYDSMRDFYYYFCFDSIFFSVYSINLFFFNFSYTIFQCISILSWYTIPKSKKMLSFILVAEFLWSPSPHNMAARDVM